MEEIPEAIEKFECLLKNHQTNEPFAMYKNRSKDAAKPLGIAKVNEVILQVSRQIKAMQSADDLKSNNRRFQLQEFGCRSQLLPINMLSAHKKATVQPESNICKFETQCISNTQLINIVQNVEELNNHEVIMQEFDSTFYSKDTNIKHLKDRNQEHSGTNIAGTQILNESTNVESPADTKILITIDTPLSPVLSTKFKDKKSTHVLKIPEYTTDSVPDRDLHYKKDKIISYKESLPHSYEEIKSILQPDIESKSLPTVGAASSFSNEDNSKGGNKQDFIDDILFSSDEENHIPKDSKDIPLTCELDTATFKENSDILETTMYVGFQTASNKSIQVCAHSFKRAKDLLDVTSAISREPTLQELVEVCDTISNESGLRPKSPVHKTIPFINENITSLAKLGNFRTASNKPIKLSAQALATCQRVFKDIVAHNEAYDCTTDNDSNADLFESDNEHADEVLKEFEKYEMSLDLGDVAADTSETHLENKSIMNIHEKALSGITKNNNNCNDNIIDGGQGDNKMLSQVIIPSSYKKMFRSSLFEIKNDKLQQPSYDSKIHVLNDTNANRKVVQIIDDNETGLNDCLNNKINNTSLDFVGFLTASNKKINISKKSLAKTKMIFKDIDLSESENLGESDKLHSKKVKKLMEIPTKSGKIIKVSELNQTEINKNYNETTTNPIFSDHAARNNKINVSDKSLVKTQSIVKDDELVKKELDDNFNEFRRPTFLGFKTANNRKINVSEAALHKSKKLLEDIETHSCEIKDKNTHNSRTTTASNKKVLTDQNSSMKSKQEFHDFETSQQTHNNNFVDFHTASNKTINVSEEALRKSKKFLEDIETHSCEIKDTESHNSGIRTGSNKKVLIGKNSLMNSKQEFQDFETSQQTHNNNFVGFHTAINKTINVSEEELCRIKKLLEDIDTHSCEIKNKETYTLGLTTASDKKVLISQDSLMKSKQVFQDFEASQQTHNNNFVGFHTASNKTINVSEEALRKSKKLLEDIDTDRCKIRYKEKHNLGLQKASIKKVMINQDSFMKSKQVFQDFETSQQTHNNNFVGFHTASNKTINVSEEALCKSKKLLEDIDTHSCEIKDKETYTLGLTTASNKKVLISQDSLMKSKQVFQDFEASQQTHNNNFVGFHTANNKTINVSEEALRKSKKLLEDIDTDRCKIRDKEKHNLGLQTASNKKVMINQDSFMKSKQVIQDFETSQATHNKNFVGFYTASNKTINVSEDALRKGKKLLEDNDTDHCKIRDKEIPNLGLQTVGNKEVLINPESWIKSKQVFQDFEISKQKHNTSFVGFHTASNKRINVSEEALCKSKMLIEDINTNSSEVTLQDKCVIHSSDPTLKNESKHFSIDVKKHEVYNPFNGFSTASNKIINVSDTALQKSKKIFQELDKDRGLDLGYNKYLLDDLEEADPPFVGFQKCDTNSEDLERSRKVLNNLQEELNNVKRNVDKNTIFTNHNKNEMNRKISDTVAEKLIDTQTIHDFYESICTEDFCKEPAPSSLKRPSSPILPCPSAKKRKKFATPYCKTKIKESKRVVEVKNINNESKSHNKKENIITLPLNHKTTKKYDLKQVDKLEKQIKESAVFDSYLTRFDFNTLLNIEFEVERNDLTDKKLKIEDIKMLFLNSVNKEIVPEGWLENHLKLIIWKLLSYEVRFPKVMKVVCTARNVIEQLAYRYTRELYNVQRPALRKILEKDDVPGKTLVLCIVGVFVEDQLVVTVPGSATNMELLLSDGWYTVRAAVDRMLTDMVCSRKLAVGNKIITRGAELVNCNQGVSPWEDTSNVRLKIFGNSTFKAPWHYRLGYHGYVPTSSLSRVLPSGGKVARMRLLITRVYPQLYVEKLDDGSVVSRSERLEQRHQMRFEVERQTVLEKLYDEVQRDMDDQDSQESQPSSSPRQRHLSDSGSQLAKRMKRSTDPAEFKACLTESQATVLENHTTREREKLIQDIQDRVQSKIKEKGLNLTRNVVQLLKLRVAGILERNGNVEITKGFLSIWRPGDLVQEMIEEGFWIEVLNVLPTAVRYSEIQLTANRQTVFQRSKIKPTEKVSRIALSMERKCYHIRELKNIHNTDYNEIDTVGLVFEIEPSTKDFTSKNNFQNVYLCDNDKNILSINFWGGLKKFGFENTLDTGQMVACVNLQKRSGNTRRNVPQYRSTDYTYFTKTPKSVAARNALLKLEKAFFGIDKRKFCDECVIVKNSNSSIRQQNNSPYISPYISKMEKISNNLRITKQEEYDLTGLDFESTFKQTETQELSPNTLQRKIKVNEKIAKLRKYGEPPPLSPISIINKSKNVANTYKSPLLTKENTKLLDESPKTTIDQEKSTNLKENCSPVMQMNRTFVKRPRVNRTKLNFSRNEENDSLVVTEKDFGEDFDASPPLSLD